VEGLGFRDSYAVKKILLNGEPHQTSAATITELVASLGLPAPTLLIEHNGEAVRRNEWPTRPISEDDRVELLRIAAGG